MTSQTSNQQTSFNPTLISTNHTPEQIKTILRTRGCSGCGLGNQEGFRAPVIFRGNPESKRMIIGEAPGLKEDIKGEPFVGPAGQLMDRVFASVGWDTSQDWYITNVCKCRPVAAPSSGKQNRTPVASERAACRPIILQEIRAINPHIIVLQGRSAAAALLPEEAKKYRTMKEMAGKVLYTTEFPDQAFFVMYHAAALLHAQSQPARYEELRQATWNHVRQLKELVDDMEDDNE